MMWVTTMLATLGLVTEYIVVAPGPGVGAPSTLASVPLRQFKPMRINKPAKGTAATLIAALFILLSHPSTCVHPRHSHHTA